LSKLEDYSAGYQTSDIGLNNYYPNTDLIGFHYTMVIVEWFNLCAKYVAKHWKWMTSV